MEYRFGTLAKVKGSSGASSALYRLMEYRQTASVQYATNLQLSDQLTHGLEVDTFQLGNLRDGAGGHWALAIYECLASGQESLSLSE
ncbi:hypothetical protein MUK42_36195, partial [Musa troglodytarum]